MRVPTPTPTVEPADGPLIKTEGAAIRGLPTYRRISDYGIVQGVILFVTLLFSLVNLLVDLSYAYLDPRIQVTRAG